MTKRSWGYHEFSSKVKESKIFSNNILRNNYKIKITSWTSSFWLMTPQFPHPLSPTHEFDTTGPLLLSPKKSVSSTQKSLISTHLSVQHQKHFSSTHPSVPHWGVCWTEGFLVLNWRFLGFELRGVLNWGCVELRVCWSEAFLMLNWGMCWTEGFFGAELRCKLNWRISGAKKVFPCVELMCWNDGGLCGTKGYSFLWTDNLCFQDFLKYIIILLKSSN